MIRTKIKMRSTLDKMLVDSVMDRVDDVLWEEFDELKEEGFFKIKILFLSYDISGKVEALLERIFGKRTQG